MKTLAAEELRELQEVSIKMAECFVDFCKKHNLTCYLCGGGCIGVIRHQGMIPWDDDLDFFMPREDYEKCWRLWKKEMSDSRYKVEKADQQHVDHNLFFTIRDSETTLIKPYQSRLDIVHGVALDVLPLDGYPNRRWQRKLQCFWALIYSLYCSQLIPINHGKLMKAACRFMLGVVPFRRLRYRIWKFAERQMTKYRIADCSGVTELCSGPGYMKNWYPKNAFAKAVFLNFEGGTMPIPQGYNDYLKIAFGDYMRMPPEEKRKGHHEALFMDLHEPYTKYKGIYYC